MGFYQFLNWLFLETSKAANENVPHGDEASIYFVLQGLIKSGEDDSNGNVIENYSDNDVDLEHFVSARTFL